MDAANEDIVMEDDFDEEVAIMNFINKVKSNKTMANNTPINKAAAPIPEAAPTQQAAPIQEAAPVQKPAPIQKEAPIEKAAPIQEEAATSKSVPFEDNTIGVTYIEVEMPEAKPKKAGGNKKKVMEPVAPEVTTNSRYGLRKRKGKQLITLID